MGDLLIMLPPKRRLVLDTSGEHGGRTPRIELPEREDEPPVFVPPAVVPPPDGRNTSTLIVDIRSQLPRNASGGPGGRELKHQGLTFHWLGADYSRSASDEESIAYLVRVAYDHIRKNWGTVAAPAFGNGIMYHEAITPLGTSMFLRDWTELAWHAGNDLANRQSRAILVMAGPNTPPTAAQLRQVKQRWEDFRKPQVRGHQEWSATQCPGPQIMEVIRSIRSQ